MTNLANHRGKTRGRTGAQPFFDGPQDLVVTPRPDQHEAAGVEPVRQQARPVQIRPPEAPQHQAGPICPGRTISRVLVVIPGRKRTRNP